MSVSRVSATSGTMAAAAAIYQAQALQYASHFGELQAAILAGDLRGSRQLLSEFQRVASGAATKGLDPVRQIPVLSKEFSGIRDALTKGDMEAARKSLLQLQRALPGVVGLPQSEPAEPELGIVQPPSKANARPVVRKAQVESETEDGSIVLENLGFLGADAEMLKEVRSPRAVAPAKSPTSTSSTFIKARPELTSFSQKSQVFPTSTDAAATLSVPGAKTLVQARVVVQGLAATQPSAQEPYPDGTAFAPTPELMLGSRGMSIPPGALLRFADKPALLEAFLS